ncbi:GNAT family N-acetyltransferase [Amycolatopsis viridis]|uniref:RimJ/RimL family protein N-acetyltransferase n=1 Tax=Amycolatopsis viridis TaxID=185678 RepID=A0ABX0T0T5_9PSEU|nr:GNAT family N-acetyltransferase [Amycolatopsis viridis]NIH81460.1 RimJ/RimL family protein N-acetyltransferase [Amycolatopsis viridis]
MTTVITLRELDGTAAEDVRSVVLACSPGTLRRRFFLPGRPDPADVLGRYRRYLLAGPPDGVALAAIDGRTTVGLLNLVAGEARVAELGIMVADPWQRQGIATGLAGWLRASGRWAGWTVRAVTQVDNAAARALLRRQGFRVRHGPQHGEYEYELTMPGPEVA